MRNEVDGYDEYQTKGMLEAPITELSKLIGQKWFLPLENLSLKTGVSLSTIIQAVRGYQIGVISEQKIRVVLEAL